MIRSSLFFSLCVPLFFLGSNLALAQSSDLSECAVPLSPTRISDPPSSAPEALEISVHWGKLTTTSRAILDSDPRRMVVVLDGSKYATDELWKLEVTLAAALFEQARALDSLALYAIADQPEALDFSVARDAQRKRLKELLFARPPHQREKRRVYDAMLAASALFGSPRFADVIFYLGGGIDHGSSSSRNATAKSLLAREVRVYGVLFKGLNFGYPPAPVANFRPDLTAVNLMELAQQSGGLLDYQSAEDPQHEFKFTPEVLKSAWERVARSYWRAVTVYRLDLSTLPVSRPAELRLAVPASSFAGHGESDLLYPHQKWACTSRSS